jgi:hypothetical protein
LFNYWKVDIWLLSIYYVYIMFSRIFFDMDLVLLSIYYVYIMCPNTCFLYFFGLGTSPYVFPSFTPILHAIEPFIFFNNIFLSFVHISHVALAPFTFETHFWVFPTFAIFFFYKLKQNNYLRNDALFIVNKHYKFLSHTHPSPSHHIAYFNIRRKWQNCSLVSQTTPRKSCCKLNNCTLPKTCLIKMTKMHWDIHVGFHSYHMDLFFFQIN